MRKKESWMFKGNTVLALGRKGIITAMQENVIKEVEYVYYIDVKLEGLDHSNPYHPNDVFELIP